MSVGLLARPAAEPGYFVVPICASGEARTAITRHGWPEWWLMACRVPGLMITASPVFASSGRPSTVTVHSPAVTSRISSTSWVCSGTASPLAKVLLRRPG
jgi:hypothetical protein